MNRHILRTVGAMALCMSLLFSVGADMAGAKGKDSPNQQSEQDAPMSEAPPRIEVLQPPAGIPPVPLQPVQPVRPGTRINPPGCPDPVDLPPCDVLVDLPDCPTPGDTPPCDDVVVIPECTPELFAQRVPCEGGCMLLPVVPPCRDGEIPDDCPTPEDAPPCERGVEDCEPNTSDQGDGQPRSSDFMGGQPRSSASDCPDEERPPPRPATPVYHPVPNFTG